MNLRKLFSLLAVVAFVCTIADAAPRSMRMKKKTGAMCEQVDMQNPPVSEFYCSKICRTRPATLNDNPVMVVNDPSGRVYYCNESDFKNFETAQNRLRQQMEMHGDMVNTMDIPATAPAA